MYYQEKVEVVIVCVGRSLHRISDDDNNNNNNGGIQHDVGGSRTSSRVALFCVVDYKCACA